ncbi:unnamed protein product [Sphagnum jensenii]
MATDWKSLSPEQKSELNAKRRERYAKLDSEALSKIRENAKSAFHNMTPEQKEARNATRRKAVHEEITKMEQGNLYFEGTLITDPEMRAYLLRIHRKMVNHEQAWHERMKPLQEWAALGGPFPWPNLVKKIRTTELWLRIIMTLRRECSNCHTKEMFDFSWRIVSKEDTLGFVPFEEKALTRVLNRINDYEVLCLECAFDLKIHLFGWIFSPYSPRNCDDPTLVEPMFETGRYTKWKKLAPIMYPSGYEALADRIKKGHVKSLTCGITGPTGNFLKTFIRKNQFIGWVGLQPNDLAMHVVVQAKYLLQAKTPSHGTEFWGWGETPWEQELLFENCGYDALSDSMKRFIEEKAKEHETRFSV